MRILLVNKYHYLRSGTERNMLNLKRLLESRGHSVEVFATRHPSNLPATYAKEFVSHVDFRGLPPTGWLGAARRVIWHPEAARRIARVLDDWRPDIVHLFNIYHHISPSILIPITERAIPLVHTLNDYKLICPNYQLFTQGQVCERCRDGHYLHAVRHRCLHNSLAWSLLATVEMTLHKRWQIYERNVDRFLAPSRFLMDRAVEFGVPGEKLLHVPYFILSEEWQPRPAQGGEYAVYFGRLSREKGLLTLLAAVKETRIPLVIVGEGPIRPELEAVVARDRLDHVRLVGYQSGEMLDRTVSGARFVVVPSEWYEVFGQVIIESFALARPVVATEVGGIPEIVSDGTDGLLVPPTSPGHLAGAMRRMWDRPQTCLEMGRAGRVKVEARFSSSLHFQTIREIYEQVCA